MGWSSKLGKAPRDQKNRQALTGRTVVPWVPAMPFVSAEKFGLLPRLRMHKVHTRQLGLNWTMEKTPGFFRVYRYTFIYIYIGDGKKLVWLFGLFHDSPSSNWAIKKHLVVISCIGGEILLRSYIWRFTTGDFIQQYVSNEKKHLVV